MERLYRFALYKWALSGLLQPALQARDFMMKRVLSGEERLRRIDRFLDDFHREAPVRFAVFCAGVGVAAVVLKLAEVLR